MTEQAKDGGPAFPSDMLVNDSVIGRKPYSGMSLRQYAAIKLCVPDSGTDWLDDMIRQAQRDRLAGQALVGLLAHASGEDPHKSPEFADKLADAMLAAREGGDA